MQAVLRNADMYRTIYGERHPAMPDVKDLSGRSARYAFRTAGGGEDSRRRCEGHFRDQTRFALEENGGCCKTHRAGSEKERSCEARRTQKEENRTRLINKTFSSRERSLTPEGFPHTMCRGSHFSVRNVLLPFLCLCLLPEMLSSGRVLSGQSGAATGGVFAPVLDSEKRPITAGGIVKSGPVIFEDIAKQAGLTTWRHTMGTPQKRYLLESTGSGVALLDYDNDGWLDIYMVNGSTFDALIGKSPAPKAALFHNNHDGTFTNVAEKAGVTNERWGFGVAVGDYDNDGWPDLYVSNFGKNRLYHNNRDGTFTDVAERAGSRSATGPTARPSATMTATAGSTSLSPAMFTGT